MKLPEFAVSKKVTATMMAMILVVIGMISFSRLGLDFFPDLEFPTVSVVTTYQGASSEDIENTLTKPLEQVVSSVNRVKKVGSMTSEGVSAIMVEFEWGTNLDFAAQDIRDQIGLYKQFLPEEAADPLVFKFNLGQMPIIFYGITANMPIRELKKLIEDEIVPRLERLDGVAAAQVWATDEREILVAVDKSALEVMGLSLDQVLAALAAENINLPAGSLVERHSDILVRTLGEFKSLDDIRRTAVGATPLGIPITVGDIADVRDTLKETRSEGRIQRQKGVYLIINKRSGANTAIAGRSVKKELNKIRTTLPADVEFHVAMDQSEMIQSVTRGTTQNALLGGIFAIGLIFLFLRNWRPTLIVALAIPLSVITTFIAFYLAGYTLNLLTLGGLALGVGMLVDNAIVVIENIFRHIEEGKGADAAASGGASEVGMAITASTLTTIAVFFPMVFASGITGKMTQGLALAVAFSLISSLFVALTLVPLFSSILFGSRYGTKIMGRGRETGRFVRFRDTYRRLLETVLRRRRLVLWGTLAVFVLSLALIPFMGTEFMPESDRDMILMKVKMPVGTSLEETDRVVAMIENRLVLEPHVKIVAAQVGSQAEQDASDAASPMTNSGTHEAILWVGLDPQDERDVTDREILESIRADLPKLRDVKYESIDISQSFSGTTSPVEIKIFGRDLDMLKEVADDVTARIRDVEGLRDLTHTLAEGKPEYHIRVDREKAYRMGLSVFQISAAVQTATQGRVATRYRDGSEEVDVRVRLQERFRNSMDELRTLPLLNPAGRMVLLDQVAEIESGEGPIQITRDNQARRVSVMANIVGRDLGSVVGEIKKRLGPMERRLPPGYFIEYAGAYEQMQEAFVIMIGAFALAALLVYMVMASQFESLRHPFIIMFTIPLSLVGVVLGLLLAGRAISLPVLIGFIVLSGIAVNNGIVMIDYINQLIRRGMKAREAILQGAATRLRPVLLTALTTILGMLPMALSTSAGSEFRAPMAITVVGGLMATTFLTLFIIPGVYSLVNRVKFK